MKDFRKLKVWEKSHCFALNIYKSTTNFPKDELYGITNQIRRSCTSIPTNIAEGCGRYGDVDFSRFLIIALGSASESEYLIQLAFDLKLLHEEEYKKLSDDIVEIKQMLTSLIRKLKS